MNVHDLDPTFHRETDDFPDEAAYVRAERKHEKAQALEDRTTGQPLEPFPTFAEFIGGADDAEC